MSGNRTFLGYRRPSGRAGTRNHLLILGINGLVASAARRIASLLPGTKLVATPYGRGQLGPDKDLHTAQLIGLGANPNVGAVIVVGADRRTAETIAQGITDRAAKPVEVWTLDDTDEDALELVSRAVRAGGRLTRDISRLRREPVALSELFLGIECGHSDATSGIAGNPLAGSLADRLVDAGGTVVVGETLEWLGAEHVLARQAASPVVADTVRMAVERREAGVAALGVDLLGNNPGEENIRGGLSSIEEKSLGAIAKAGSRPIRSLLAHAEPPAAAGLHLMDGHGFSPESMTGFAAAGAQIMLFVTGPGNSFCSLLAPTLKISANPRATAGLPEQIDYDASALFRGTDDFEVHADGLLDTLIDIASGTLSWGEIFGEGDEAFARIGGSH